MLKAQTGNRVMPAEPTEGQMESPTPTHYDCNLCIWSTEPADCFVCRVCQGYDSHTLISDVKVIESNADGL